MYKLIATDLDGTLLDDNHQMPEVNREYIQKAMDCGVNVALCSGRNYLSLNHFEKHLGLNKKGCYGISFNGGIVYDAYSGEILNDIRMPLATALELIELSRPFIKGLNVDIMVYCGAALYIEQSSVNANTEDYSRITSAAITTISSFGQLPCDPTKILFKGENAQLKQVEKSALGFIGDKCKMFFTSPVLLEMIPPESGKDVGLNALVKRLGISMDEVIAVGDQVNDVDMIRAAGFGIAVANAVDAAKAAADYVAETDNNAGIFRELVTKFIL